MNENLVYLSEDGLFEILARNEDDRDALRDKLRALEYADECVLRVLAQKRAQFQVGERVMDRKGNVFVISSVVAKYPSVKLKTVSLTHYGRKIRKDSTPGVNEIALHWMENFKRVGDSTNG